MILKTDGRWVDPTIQLFPLADQLSPLALITAGIRRTQRIKDPAHGVAEQLTSRFVTGANHIDSLLQHTFVRSINLSHLKKSRAEVLARHLS